MVATRLKLMITVGCLCGASASVALAQSYPVKPVRLIVPFVPGGGSDAAARLFGAKLSEGLGQQVVIDNRGGAGGTIGAELASRAPADGYHLLLGTANMAMNATLYPKLNYDAVRDFVPVSLLATSPNIFAVHPSLPVKTLADLIALARRIPGEVNYASGGSGSTSHLAAELFKAMAKVSLTHVPYKGTGPALIAVLSGEVPMTMAPAIAVLPHVKSGRMRPIAITSTQRSPMWPTLPTVAEAGVAGYEAGQWYGIMTPAGAPEAIISRLHSELVKIVNSSDMRSRLANDATIPIGSTPQEFGAYLKDEIAKWARAVKLSGARVE